jgi:hypothetical protein
VCAQSAEALEAGNRGSGAGVGDTGSGAEAEDTDSRAEADDTGSEAGGGGFGAEDEGLRPLDGLSTSRGIQNKRLRPLSSSSSSSSTSSELDSRSSNPSISRRVGKSSRLGSKGTLLSGLVDIARDATASTSDDNSTLGFYRTAGFPIYLLCHRR